VFIKEVHPSFVPWIASTSPNNLRDDLGVLLEALDEQFVTSNKQHIKRNTWKLIKREIQFDNPDLDKQQVNSEFEKKYNDKYKVLLSYSKKNIEANRGFIVNQNDLRKVLEIRHRINDKFERKILENQKNFVEIKPDRSFLSLSEKIFDKSILVSEKRTLPSSFVAKEFDANNFPKKLPFNSTNFSKKDQKL